MDNVVNQLRITDKYAIYEGDSCEVMPSLPSDSVGYSLHSPPFEGLYKFSNSDRDVSNSNGETFWQHYGFIIRELLRITNRDAFGERSCGCSTHQQNAGWLYRYA